MSAHLAETLIRLVSGTLPEDYQLRHEVLERFGGEADARGIAAVLINEHEPQGSVVAGTGFDGGVASRDVDNGGHVVLHPGMLAIRIRVDGNARPAVAA